MGWVMSSLFELGKRILRDQPFSSLIGAELTLLDAGAAEITLDVRKELKQQHGFVHGGVLSYLADNCLTYAGGSVLGNSVTSEYKISFVRPAIGEKLIARATVLAKGRRQATCECRISVLGETEELLVAVAQGTISKVEYEM